MRMKRILALFIIITMMLTMPISFASADGLTASSQLTDNNLVITGSGADANSLVSVYILKSEVSAEAISDSNRPEIVEAVFSETDGSFSLNITLSLALTTGQYKINAVSGSNSWESETFSYVNPAELSALSGQVNLAADAGAVKSLLEPFQIVINMPNLDYTAQYLFAVRPTAGYSENSFNEEMQRSAAFYLLSQKETVENLEKYKSYFIDDELELDCYEQYKSLSESAKASYLDMVSTIELKATDALERIYSAGMISSVAYAESWKDLQNIICDGSEDSKFFTEKIAKDTKYDDLTYPDKVFQELYRDKESLTDIDVLKSLFADSAEDLYEEEQDAEEDKGSSGGGGGGGSRGGSSVSLWGPDMAEVVEPKAETQQPVQSGKSFNDVAGHWGEKQIYELVELGAADGYPDGGFHPDNAVGRAEFIKLLCGVFTLDAAGEASFADVAADAWYAPFVSKAAAAGLIKGDENNCFNPADTVSRQDAMVILSRLLKLENGYISGKFTDENEISAYAAGAVAAMYDNGLINGMGDGSFAPKNNTTRAQVATMLLNCKAWLESGIGGAIE